MFPGIFCKKTIEFMGRVDAVHSAFGDNWEYAAGINWFINGTHKHKLTLDVAEVDGVPAGSSSPNYETGQTGTLFRIQYQFTFEIHRTRQPHRLNGCTSQSPDRCHPGGPSSRSATGTETG